jgi:hypothetical protein
MLASDKLSFWTMGFFFRTAITVRCPCRGATLAVPSRDALLDACEAKHRRRLQHCLAGQTPWSVEWQKAIGAALRSRDTVAVLRRDDVIVELAYTQRGTLAEFLVAEGEQAVAGAPLARVERRAKPATPPDGNELLRQYVAQQRRDAEIIKRLEADLAQWQRLADRLHEEVSVLRLGDPGTAADAKFVRVKHEFSKRFHPNARAAGDPERDRREQVFREFWPVVEEIERS